MLFNIRSESILNEYNNLMESNFCLGTFLHSANVANIAARIGENLGIPLVQRRSLYELALYHDIGKSKIPKSILHKEDKLTYGEWEVMKMHPIYSQEIYLNMRKKSNENVVNSLVLRYHHENWDGSGYPDGISGKNIPVFSRIIRIADVFDAITQPRVYRTFKIKNAIEMMGKMQGKELDPYIYGKCLNTLKEMLNYKIEKDKENWRIEKL